MSESSPRLQSELAINKFINRELDESELESFVTFLRERPELARALGRHIYLESLLLDLGKGDGENIGELDFLGDLGDTYKQVFQKDTPAAPVATHKNRRKRLPFFGIRKRTVVRVFGMSVALTCLVLFFYIMQVPYPPRSQAAGSENAELNLRSFYSKEFFHSLPGLSIFMNEESRPKDLPKLYSTRLILTQEGRPLADAVVAVVSADETSVWSGVGITNASGEAVLYTNGHYAGVPEGTFKVLVSKVVSEHSQPVPSEPDPKTDRLAWVQWQQKYHGDHMIPKSFMAVELQYSKRSSTPLQITVSADKANEFTLDAGQSVSIPSEYSIAVE